MQGLGDHLGAVRELNRGIAAASTELQRIELRFLRGGWGWVGVYTAHKAGCLGGQQRIEPRSPRGARAAQAGHPTLELHA